MAKEKTEKMAGADKSACSDKHCPIHGAVKIRGRSFTAIVVSDKMAKTVVVSWSRRFYVPKFERFEIRRSRISAHNPECIAAKKGDVVKIVETRPLSKTKHFTVTEKVGAATKKQNVKFEAIEESDATEGKGKKHEIDHKAKSDDE